MWALMYANEPVEKIERINLGGLTASCPTCGAIYWQAEHLANERCNELPFWCCGKTTKTLLSETATFSPIKDDYIRELYYGSSKCAEHFRKNIRSYNAVLSTAMPRVAYNKAGKTAKTVTVGGSICFNAPSCPNIQDSGLPAHHGQLYFLDMTRDTVQKRMSASTNKEIREDILSELEKYLRAHNGLVRTFQYASQVQKQIQLEEGEDSASRVAVVVNPHRNGMRGTERELLTNEAPDLLRPSDSECVAAVIVGSEIRYSYDMVFHLRARTHKDPLYMEVHLASPTLDMMLYPLIHLHAEDSWVQRVIADNRKRKRNVEMGTLREYYSSRIMMRRGQDILFRCKGLFQQYLLDAALKIMDSNLNYFRDNQDELQVCQYDTLKRYTESVAEKHNKQPGRTVLIPKAEQKSERSMYNYYMDSVRIAMEYDPPTLFITYTVNPRWPEIVQGLSERNLKPDEYMDAPDIVVRVFLARLNVFLSDIIHKSVFGRVKAYIGVTEFTSTMLPHYHLAVMLHPVDRPESACEVDALLSAEIPDPETDPEGHELVMALMIHRPCDGSSEGYKPICRPNGGPCKHGFPKPFRSFTHVNRNGHIPRRRKTRGFFHAKFKCMVDNRWTVEHNLRILKRHGNHVNIRCCSETIFFKYLFSYMQKETHGQHMQGSVLRHALGKGEDVLDWDEIEAFKELRIIGAYEAVYRILGRSFVDMSHKVESLPIHLPDMQQVYYRGDPTLAARYENSKLLAFFKLAEEEDDVKSMLYQDIIAHFK